MALSVTLVPNDIGIAAFDKTPVTMTKDGIVLHWRGQDIPMRGRKTGVERGKAGSPSGWAQAGNERRPGQRCALDPHCGAKRRTGRASGRSSSRLCAKARPIRSTPGLDEAGARAYWFAADKTIFVAEMTPSRASSAATTSSPTRPARRPCLQCGLYRAARPRAVAALPRSLCRHSIEEARRRGYRAMQYNLVISTNDRAVRLGSIWASRSSAPCPALSGGPMAIMSMRWSCTGA